MRLSSPPEERGTEVFLNCVCFPLCGSLCSVLNSDAGAGVSSPQHGHTVPCSVCRWASSEETVMGRGGGHDFYSHAPCLSCTDVVPPTAAPIFVCVERCALTGLKREASRTHGHEGSQSAHLFPVSLSPHASEGERGRVRPSTCCSLFLSMSVWKSCVC